MLQVGDAVRVVAGTGSAELLDGWLDLVGEVEALSDDGEAVWVVYAGPTPGYAMALPAAHFAADAAPRGPAAG